MKIGYALAAAAVLLAGPTGVASAGDNHDPAMHKAADTAAAEKPAAFLPQVSGTVTKVDETAGKITIDHQAIPNLQMDPMTMVFKASDTALLRAAKPGDAVKFTADKVNGQLTVMSLEKGK
jgi:Cu(I)/Ag(I) efflux system periplasmic protein CusF